MRTAFKVLAVACLIASLWGLAERCDRIERYIGMRDQTGHLVGAKK